VNQSGQEVKMMDKKGNNMSSGARRKALLGLALVVALIGVWRFGVGAFSQLDDGLMWFNNEASLSKAREEAKEPLGEMHAVCQGILGHEALKLDDPSMKKLETYCGRLERAFATRSVHHILQYMSYHKTFFDYLVLRLEGQISLDVAAQAMEMQVVECKIRPPLEDIKSISASARVSDLLFGLFLMLVASVFFYKLRKKSTVTPA
jgi:hypothetical protein